MIDESLCTAIQNGLGTNATLEHLKFKRVHLFNDTADLRCRDLRHRAFSFLRTNKASKSLAVHVRNSVWAEDDDASCISAVRIDIAAMLQENASLESLSLLCEECRIEGEVYFVLITALQVNTTLKTLSLYQYERLMMKANKWPRSSRKTMPRKDFPIST
jgi:hypothetical protein